jgi:hypothetical protein
MPRRLVGTQAVLTHRSAVLAKRGIYAVATLYFYWKDYAPVVRYWSFVPRVGDTVVLPELGGNGNGLQVCDVVYEGFDEPNISIYVSQSRIDRDGSEKLASDDGEPDARVLAP